MKRTSIFGVLVLLLVVAGQAMALAPSLLIWADSGLRQALNVPLQQGKDGIYFLDKFEFRTREYSIRIADVRLDPDPSISYGITVADFGAPSTFSFAFSTPIVPTASPSQVHAWVGGMLTDLTGNGLAFNPTGSALQVSKLGTPNPSVNMGVDVGQSFSAGPQRRTALYTYGLYSSGLLAGPGPGPWTGLGTEVAFRLSGGGDIAALLGHTEIAASPAPVVPEPATALLLGLGLVGGLAGLARRRR